MRSRGAIVALATVALTLPAAALAEGLAPHSSWYEVHPRSSKPENDVTIVVNDKQGSATLTVSNFCLGTQRGGPAGQSYPNAATIRSASVHRGKLSFSGSAIVYQQMDSSNIPVKLSGKVASKKATGTVEFKSGSCGKVSFEAKLVQRRK